MSIANILQLPPKVLKTIPIAPAPKGVIPNFINPTGLSLVYRILGGTLLAVTLGFTAIRFYVKLRIVAKLTSDDCMWFQTMM